MFFSPGGPGQHSKYGVLTLARGQSSCLRFHKNNLGTKLLVRALLQGSFPATFGAAGRSFLEEA